MNRLHPGYGSLASDTIRAPEEDREIDRQNARARVMDTLHKLAVVTAGAHEDDALTTAEAESIALLCDEFGQSEPLADVLARHAADVERIMAPYRAAAKSEVK